MGHEANIWGTKKDASIEDAVTELLERRQCIRVDQVEMVETGRVFRARDGMVLELYMDPANPENDEVRVAYIGTTVHAYIKRALLVHAGEERPTESEIKAAASDDLLARMEAVVDAELNDLFQRIMADQPSRCGSCDKPINVKKYVAKLPCGSLLCERCVYSQPVAAAAE